MCHTDTEAGEGLVPSQVVYLDPSPDNTRALIDRGVEGPIAMLNLLRFREVANYGDFPELAPTAPISGRVAYDRYIRHTRPFLEATGESVVMVGVGGNFFVGPTEERWDLALLVRRNSLADFFSFATNEEYLAGIGHRSASVEDTRLLPLIEIPAP